MKILATDTGTPYITIALCEPDHVRVEVTIHGARSHSERLLETVDWVLAQADCSLEDVDLLALSIGPGSFTGLRVGAAAWKGLAFASRIPLVAVPTLDALTRLVPVHNGLVCPLLDARMGEVFGALYRFQDGEREKLTPDRVCPIEELLDAVNEPVHVFGDGATRYASAIRSLVPDAVFLPECVGQTRASAVAAEARMLVEAGASTDAALVSPVYLRKSQAEENREKTTGH